MAYNNTSTEGRMFYLNCFGGYTRKFPFLIDSESSSVNIGASIPFLLWGLLTGILNLLTFIVICKNHSLESIPNIIIASLCLTDMLAGFITAPLVFVIAIVLAIEAKISYSLNMSLAVLISISFYVATVTYFMQIVIWTERYIGIFYPYFYRKWIVKKFTVKFLTATWILLLAIFLMSIFCGRADSIVDFAMYSFPVFVVWCVYVQLKTFLLVRRMRKEVISLSTPYQERRAEIHVFATSRATKVGLSIFFAFIICYTPYLVTFFLYRYKLDSQIKLVSHCSWTSFLVLFNSLCNVVIYSVRMKKIREAIFRLFRGAMRTTDSVDT